MGQEIADTHFRERDFTEFRRRLDAETELLGVWFREGRLSGQGGIGGYELEAWLVDGSLRAAPVNQAFLERLGDERVVPELARFNVELNGAARVLRGDALSAMHRELEEIWRRCEGAAAEPGVRPLMTGILPTLRESELSLANMSPLKRYRALNEQVLRLRDGRPLRLDIQGREHLHVEHHDLMLEAAATSFQIHLQVGRERAVRAYNAALIASAPIVAAAANSPYLFGRDLWDETRIPLFEQSAEVGGYDGAAGGPTRRVTFGSDYARDSLLEWFVENRDHYPVLLPMCSDGPPEALAHLRLHNGTIWRWNRPLIGIESGGGVHLRIEHRAVPGGPTVADAIANAALFFGLVESLGARPVPPEHELAFACARDNFYAAARFGLRANVGWFGERRGPVQALLLDELLPAARRGLRRLELDAADADEYLGIIEARVRTARNGTAWQRAWVERHGRDPAALTAAYLERQGAGAPVHEWTV
ncbi:carboxylate-amine ligase YbdK [bacterium BMS3Bbin12]|nr:carboxylate-amine ligase YbdK [bacterium BMS3Abin12]GBE47944.1 carboxylate-amine ligase YbdK [bacterium BMS3Bbin12]GBE49390.1 carboxylate-amine ligase YbdK [bacterium BMS3Bbin13]HDJ86564.1 glutamate--cysteine ligase [Chromatiales bacterium]